MLHISSTRIHAAPHRVWAVDVLPDHRAVLTITIIITKLAIVEAAAPISELIITKLITVVMAELLTGPAVYRPLPPLTDLAPRRPFDASGRRTIRSPCWPFRACCGASWGPAFRGFRDQAQPGQIDVPRRIQPLRSGFRRHLELLPRSPATRPPGQQP